MFFRTATPNHNWVNEAVIFAASAINAGFYRERDSTSPALVTVIIAQSKALSEAHGRRELKSANEQQRISKFSGSEC